MATSDSVTPTTTTTSKMGNSEMSSNVMTTSELTSIIITASELTSINSKITTGSICIVRKVHVCHSQTIFHGVMV